MLCGDFNTMPNSPAYRQITGVMIDAQRAVPQHRAQKTWFGPYPLQQFDYIFLSPGIEAVAARVPRSELAQVASDHLPLIVDLRLPPRPNPSTT